MLPPSSVRENIRYSAEGERPGADRGSKTSKGCLEKICHAVGVCNSRDSQTQLGAVAIGNVTVSQWEFLGARMRSGDSSELGTGRLDASTGHYEKGTEYQGQSDGNDSGRPPHREGKSPKDREDIKTLGILIRVHSLFRDRGRECCQKVELSSSSFQKLPMSGSK